MLPRISRKILSASALAGLACTSLYLFLAFYYASKAGFLDHFEPSVAEGGLRVLYGIPVFHPPDAAERYCSIYGPNVYLIQALFVAFPPSVVMGSKLAGPVFVVLFLALSISLLWKKWGPSVASVLSGYTALSALTLLHVAYWNRPDPMLLAAVALSLWTMELRHPTGKAIFLGFSAALLFNSKVHTVLPLLPVLGMMAYERRWRPLIYAGLVALLLILLPFCFSKVFSLSDFVYRLNAARSHGLSSDMFCVSLQRISLLAFPLVLVGLFFQAPSDPDEKKKQNLFLVLLAAAFFLTLIFASKPGAGTHHFLIYFPVFAYWMAWRTSSPFRWNHLAWVFIALMGLWTFRVGLRAGATQKILCDAMRKLNPEILRDLRTIRDAYPTASVQMSVVDEPDHIVSWLRPELRRPSSVSLFDSSAMMDMNLAGEELPAATFALIQKQKIDIWLAPKGARPFSLFTKYRPRRDVFPDSFRQAFSENYTLAKSTKYFDLYLANRLE
jgi:hypothetical protein